MFQHPIKAWIDRNDITQMAFAEAVGIGRSHLTLILNCERGVSLKTALKIHEFTRGEIPLDAIAAFAGIARKRMAIIAPKPKPKRKPKKKAKT